MSFNSEMTSLADAIRAKSGVSGKLTISGMTGAVDSIVINPGSDIDFTGVNVTADKLLSGIVAINASGVKVAGNVPTVTASVSGNNVVVPVGYIATEQTFPVSSGYDTSSVTATADNMLSGVIAIGRNGETITGNIVTVTPSISANVFTVRKGYVAQDTELTVPEAAVTETDSSVTIGVGYVSEELSFARGSGIDFTGVNVTSDKLLAGTVAINASGNKVTGNIQTVTATKDGNKVTVPSGHIALQQIITVGTAKSAATITPGTSDQTIAADTYLSGKLTIKGDANLTAENIKSGVSIFNIEGTFVGAGGGTSTIEYGYITDDGKVQKLDLSGAEPVASGSPVDMQLHLFNTGVPEPEYSVPEPEPSNGTFDLAKVTEYTPYDPAMTAVTAVSVSGMGTLGDEEDFTAANGTYNVTAETAGETDWKKRIYRHETEEYYLFYYADADYPEDAYWQFGTDTDSGFLTLYSTENISSGENDWENWDWGETFTLTTTVTETSIPETPMVLKGVLATGYADGEWSFDTAEKSFDGFEETPAKDYVYAVDNADNVLVGSPVAYIDIFPGTSALFALDASRGTTELVNGGTPSLVGSGTVLQNGEFCFDTVRALDYTIGSTMSALKDFTIEMDYTITSDTTGFCGFFGNKSSWSAMNVCVQWGRSGYRPAMFWNDYFDTNTGGAEHPEWVNDGKYHHVAMVRKDSIVSLYSDGERIAYYSGATKDLNLAIVNLLSIGTQHVENVILPGRMKHFRVLPFARYTNNFKPANWVGK